MQITFIRCRYIDVINTVFVYKECLGVEQRRFEPRCEKYETET